mmetsp:Transcript_125435/g.360430  ORF Transcript_125435/g.360430 Transcript_125435/m.360430 type:complete len:827 (-) Transcript_125435:223-2703(-)
MEVGFWRYLFAEDDSRLFLRQRAPEVLLFRGCRLEAWFHSNANGMFTRRLRNVTVQRASEVFFTSVHGFRQHSVVVGRRFGAEDLDPQAPAAILRCFGAGGGDLPDVPQATVLTVQELAETFQRAQNGVEDEAASVWSLQTMIYPSDDLRVLSVYSCEASGLELSDIFGRSYSRLYTLASIRKASPVPLPETAAEHDHRYQVSVVQRAAVEAKTLGFVRFASRFHGIELEGVVLEFVFDPRGHAVLHGCWCASLFAPGVRRKFRSGSTAQAGGSSVPRAFPVPSPLVAVVAPATPPAYVAPSMNKTDTEDPELPGRGAASDTPSAALGEESPDVLLEVWRGDEFLGEAFVACGGREQRLRLLRSAAAGGGGGPTRHDRRKQGLGLGSGDGVAGPVGGSVLLGASWKTDSVDKSPFLCFSLGRADGLPPAAADATARRRPRALLWLRRGSGTSIFFPLWASQDGDEEDPRGTSAAWGESAELRITDFGSSGVDVFAAAFGSASTGVADGASDACGTSSGIDQVPGNHRPQVELKSVLRSAREQVCGAAWNAHWGTCDIDGTMRGSTLAAQVSQRWGTEKLNRSLLLHELGRQVEHFSDIQQAWETQIADAKTTTATRQGEMSGKRQEAARVRTETAVVVKDHEKRLVQACRQMFSVLDEHRFQEHKDDVALEQSKQRIAEQRAMIHELVDRSHNLQASLERTVNKFDEVSTSYAQVQAELMRAQIVHPREPNDLVDTIGQAQQASAEVAQETRNVQSLKKHLAQMHEDLAYERELSARLEDFVRRIADAPQARLRTGGGFQLSNTAKVEATAVLEHLGLRGSRVPAS